MANYHEGGRLDVADLIKIFLSTLMCCHFLKPILPAASVILLSNFEFTGKFQEKSLLLPHFCLWGKFS